MNMNFNKLINKFLLENEETPEMSPNSSRKLTGDEALALWVRKMITSTDPQHAVTAKMLLQGLQAKNDQAKLEAAQKPLTPEEDAALAAHEGSQKAEAQKIADANYFYGKGPGTLAGRKAGGADYS